MRNYSLVCTLLLLASSARADGAKRSPSRSSVAVIDMGSSGVKLLVQDAHGRTLADAKRSTGLGRDIGADRLLPRANQERTLAALSELTEIARHHGIPAAKIELITTAAVRNADGAVAEDTRLTGKKSGRKFIDEDVRGRLGLVRARILSGHQEASIGYQGALARFLRTGESESSRFVVVDTGGGSHQVIAGTLRSITIAGSTQFGANQVAEKVLIDDNGDKQQTLSDAQLRLADEKLAVLVPSLPIDAEHTNGARVVAIGGASKVLSNYFGRLDVTRGEIETFRRQIAGIPVAARGEFLSKGADGAQLDEARAKVITRAAGGDLTTYSAGLPAKLTLFLRVMTMLGKTAPTDTFSFSETDARHALAATLHEDAR